MAQFDATDQIILQKPDGTLVWLGEWSAVSEALFLPTGLLDLLPLTAIPDNPPLGRMRVAMIEEPPGSGSGLFRLHVLDDAGGVVVAIPSKLGELFDVDTAVLPNKGSLVVGDGASPGTPMFRELAAPTVAGLALQTAPASPFGVNWLQIPGGDLLGDEFVFGSPLDYVEEAAPVDDEIQYVRVALSESLTIASMRTVFTNFTGPGANLRMGIYDQTDVTNPSLGPNNKVAETAIQAIGAAGVFDVVLGAAYPVTTTGYYWLAWVLDYTGGNKRVSSSGAVPASFLPIRYEVGAGGAALPATAAAGTNPGGPVLLTTAKV